MEESKSKDSSEAPQQVIFEFNCSGCGMSETAHYKGSTPPFSRNIILKYPSYVMKDPFSPPGKGEIMVIGADCALCGKPVCVSKGCSVFYSKMYCKDCACDASDKFPLEVKSKISQFKR